MRNLVLSEILKGIGTDCDVNTFQAGPKSPFIRISVLERTIHLYGDRAVLFPRKVESNSDMYSPMGEVFLADPKFFQKVQSFVGVSNNETLKKKTAKIELIQEQLNAAHMDLSNYVNNLLFTETEEDRMDSLDEKLRGHRIRSPQKSRDPQKCEGT